MRGSCPPYGANKARDSVCDTDGMTGQRVEQFLNEFSHWASMQSDIRGAALVGSHACGKATEKSDVDLVVLVEQPGKYLHNRAWAQAFGNVLDEQVEDYGNLISLRVQYEDQLEVEYGLTDEKWAAIPLDEGTREVICGGMTVLFERGFLLSRLADSLDVPLTKRCGGSAARFLVGARADVSQVLRGPSAPRQIQRGELRAGQDNDTRPR